MPVLGNNVAGGFSLSLTPTDLFILGNPARMAAYGNPIPNALVTRIYAYCLGPVAPQPNATVQFAIYDSSGGVPINYPLVATSPTWTLNQGAPAAWRSVACAIVLPAGTYAIAILSNSGGAFTGSVYYRNMVPLGCSLRGGIVPGTFPNPLAVCNNSVSEWSMYLDYTIITGDGYTPTAAGICQPKCGG